ncbi:MAG: hypothetical protein HYY84_06590 [Deltaproteobacteria bacterium]|nr:hypothetical protein [Deltaproteobacteria bacterium]
MGAVVFGGCVEDLSCDGERSSSPSSRRRNLSRAASGAAPVDLGEEGRERKALRVGERASARGDEELLRRVADAGVLGRGDLRRPVRYQIIAPTSTERGGCSYFEKGKSKPTHARSLADVPIDYRDEAVCASR